MPRKALRCSVQLQIHTVSCPGVYLPRRDDVYLSIRMFGERRQSQLINPSFPLIFHDNFKINKVFYTAHEPSQVDFELENEPVIIELIQLAGSYGNCLAYLKTNAKDFLYPLHESIRNYGTQDRSILLERTIEFPGISPKLEFSTKSTISETTSPSMDIYDDLQLIKAMDHERRPRIKSARRSRSRTRSSRRNQTSGQTSGKKGFRYRRPTVASACRCRSASPRRLVNRMETLNLDGPFNNYDDHPKPPFVVRHVDSNLIGRQPSHLERNSRMRSRSIGNSRDGARKLYAAGTTGWYKNTRTSADDGYVMYGKALDNYLSESPRGRSRFRQSNYNSSDESDYVLAGGDEDYLTYESRHRSISPLRSPYRKPLVERFGEYPYNSAHSEYISSTVNDALRRNRYMDNSQYRIDDAIRRKRELDELRIDLELARSKRLSEDRMSRLYARDHYNSLLYNSYSAL